MAPYSATLSNTEDRWILAGSKGLGLSYSIKISYDSLQQFFKGFLSEADSS